MLIYNSRVASQLCIFKEIKMFYLVHLFLHRCKQIKCKSQVLFHHKTLTALQGISNPSLGKYQRRLLFYHRTSNQMVLTVLLKFLGLQPMNLLILLNRKMIVNMMKKLNKLLLKLLLQKQL